VSLRPLIYDEATDIVQVHINNPLARFTWPSSIASPAWRSSSAARLPEKTLTPRSRRENGCSVAINANGNVRRSGSGRVMWRQQCQAGAGLFGEEPKIPRPLLAFDARTAPRSPRRRVRPHAFSGEIQCIWGRWDAIINGAVPVGDTRDRQPRTAMAINRRRQHSYI